MANAKTVYKPVKFTVASDCFLRGKPLKKGDVLEFDPNDADHFEDIGHLGLSGRLEDYEHPAVDEEATAAAARNPKRPKVTSRADDSAKE